MIAERETFITELEPVEKAINNRYDGRCLERLHLSLALNRLEIETEVDDEPVYETAEYEIYFTNSYWDDDLEQYIKRFCADETKHIMGLVYVLHQVACKEYHEHLNIDETSAPGYAYVILPKN